MINKQQNNMKNMKSKHVRKETSKMQKLSKKAYKMIKLRTWNQGPNHTPIASQKGLKPMAIQNSHAPSFFHH